MNGFVPLEREVVKYEFYRDIPAKTLYLHLRLISTYSCYNYGGVDLLPFQVLTSVRKLAYETGLTVKQVRLALDRLSSCSAIDVEVRGRGRYGGTLITIQNMSLTVKDIGRIDAEFEGLIDLDLDSKCLNDLKKIDTLFVLAREKLCNRIFNITNPRYQSWMGVCVQVLGERHNRCRELIYQKEIEAVSLQMKPL